MAPVSGVLSTVGKVAGIVATVAAFIPGGQPVALIAAAVSAGANVGASLLAVPPPAKGSVNGITVGSDQPMPYLIGETYYGGSRAYQIGYGPTVKKVQNPYALIVDTYSGAGPIEGLVDAQADFVSLGIPPAGGAATGYAAGFLWASVQRGAVPEQSALQPHWAGAPGWGTDYRLSGHAAIAWSLLFDRDGKIFASGVPQLGAIWRGQLCWDPRQDSTYPGGCGSHRWAVPADTAAHDAARASWSYTNSPGLNALKYALGVYQRDPRVAGSTYQKVAGVGLPIDAVIVEDFIHLANVCAANGWTCGGVIFEPATGGQSTRWQNLCDILAAGGAEPCWRGGRLGLKINAPRVALDTITAADLADDETVVSSGSGWEERLNTIVPKWRSPDHKWEYVASTKPVSIALQIEIDGEVKRAERQFNLVQDGDQGAELAAYELFNRRELGEIEIVVKPRLRRYGPGDMVIVDLPDDGLVQQPCVILKRQPMPDRMAWKFTLMGETPGKHAFALGQMAVAPPIPALRSTSDLDGVAVPVADTNVEQLIIANSYPINISLIGHDEGGSASVTVSAHSRVYQDRTVSVAASSITGLQNSTSYYLYYDDAARTGGTVQAMATTVFADAFTSSTNPARHPLGSITTPAPGGADSGGSGSAPPGGGGGEVNPNVVEQ
ncbi:phage tail protein [Sphingomonas pseudosanguinis]|uniref:phage tail protein n=1 Tax=Sphingomonas pseudosanguinis TaxID=413712 RepID=UPI003F83AF3B